MPSTSGLSSSTSDSTPYGIPSDKPGYDSDMPSASGLSSVTSDKTPYGIPLDNPGCSQVKRMKTKATDNYNIQHNTKTKLGFTSKEALKSGADMAGDSKSHKEGQNNEELLSTLNDVAEVLINGDNDDTTPCNDLTNPYIEEMSEDPSSQIQEIFTRWEEEALARSEEANQKSESEKTKPCKQQNNALHTVTSENSASTSNGITDASMGVLETSQGVEIFNSILHSPANESIETGKVDPTAGKSSVRSVEVNMNGHHNDTTLCNDLTNPYIEEMSEDPSSQTQEIFFKWEEEALAKSKEANQKGESKKAKPCKHENHVPPTVTSENSAGASNGVTDASTGASERAQGIGISNSLFLSNVDGSIQSSKVDQTAAFKTSKLQDRKSKLSRKKNKARNANQKQVNKSSGENHVLKETSNVQVGTLENSSCNKAIPVNCGVLANNALLSHGMASSGQLNASTSKASSTENIRAVKRPNPNSDSPNEQDCSPNKRKF